MGERVTYGSFGPRISQPSRALDRNADETLRRRCAPAVRGTGYKELIGDMEDETNFMPMRCDSSPILGMDRTVARLY
jgi:hypothetical protein